MNWGEVRIRVGGHYCPEHGEVRPRAGTLVPACPHCGRAAHRGVDAAGAVVVVEVRPCACGQGHRLDKVGAAVGTQPCSCAVDGIHRTWTCGQCGDVRRWPPHDETKVAPYFGPGAGRRSAGDR
ncbi:hypothetical protein E1091_11830 [Micromonospora fluostatini]|uniref:Uncharacterized protein n=1 Tax=Micromonospora fluostatini TaxID=1629071 RepID=A0ABY2DG09_9ACTN|nr:hypothetical protein E1091_11830 [Micromonospora fluostatini]